MTKIEEIIETVGVAVLATSVGSAQGAVYNARRSGMFPAKWYQVVCGLCAERGLECSLELFNFARPAGKVAAPQPALPAESQASTVPMVAGGAK